LYLRKCRQIGCRCEAALPGLARQGRLPPTLAPAASAGEQSPRRPGDCFATPSRYPSGKERLAATRYKRFSRIAQMLNGNTIKISSKRAIPVKPPNRIAERHRPTPCHRSPA
jgi:hypothetical protein